MLGRDADDWVCACREQDDAARFYRVLPQRVAKCNLQVAPEKTRLLRCSRLHPGRQRRCTLLGFACCWRPERQGVARVKRRTARKTLQAACQRSTAWIKQPRHLPGRAFSRGVSRRFQGHDHDYGLPGNARARQRLFERAMRSVFTWRKRRGGKRQSFTWEQCTQGLERIKRARPRITEAKRRRVFA